MIFNANADMMDYPALGYLGVEWTFKKFKTEVDKASNAFIALGIKENDVVLFGVSNCPGAIVCLLALNKIGAISKWFDVRASGKDIQEYANSSNCVCMVVFDMLLSKVTSIVKATTVNNVIVMSPADYLPKYKQVIYNIKNANGKLPDDNCYISYKHFISSATNNFVAKSDNDNKKPSIMVQSSGTTGKPKTIVHANSSMINMTRSLSYSDLPVCKGKTILVALPPWIAYCLGEAIIYPLAMGAKVELCPNFDNDILFKYIGKFNTSFAAPFHYRYLKDNYDSFSSGVKSKIHATDCMISGGDKISIDENRAFENLFQTTLVNGYGNNEGFGALTVNPTKHNKYGTVGIPKWGETVIAYDENTDSELKYGEVGEICSLTNTLFVGYENNGEETDKVKQLHSDKQFWLHTGDLGFVDEEGFITLVGRKTRVIVRLGFKIAAYTIEDKICEHESVKECVAVSVEDPEEEHAPMVFIVLKDEYKDNIAIARESIIEKCKSELKEYEIPKHFRFVDSLPYTANGKYDFKLLEKMGNEENNI